MNTKNPKTPKKLKSIQSQNDSRVKSLAQLSKQATFYASIL
jgi:hypothetical protein